MQHPAAETTATMAAALASARHGLQQQLLLGKRAAIASLHLDQRSCITNLIAKRSINLSQPFACFSRLAHATVTVGDGG